MTREQHEHKVASRCQAATEFLGAVVVGLIFAFPFLVEIVKELAK